MKRKSVFCTLLLVGLTISCNAPQSKKAETGIEREAAAPIIMTAPSDGYVARQTIPLPRVMQRYYPKRDRELWSIRLSPDSKLEVVAGWAESEVGLIVHGRFWFVEENAEQHKVRCGFELLQKIVPSGGYGGDEDTSEYETIALSGIFEAQINDDNYMLTVIKGDKKAANLLGFERINQTIDFYNENYWYQAVY